MKSNRNEEEFEHSQLSIDFLTQQIKGVLAKKFGIETPWFPDSPQWYKSLPKSDEGSPIDIVLYGSFVQRFFETGNLIGDNYRFWVLSNQVKKVLTELLGMPEDSITVIPRSEICPPGQAKEIQNDSFDLVFSGRISPVKNIEFYLLFNYFLQKDHQVNCRPVLFGNFDNITHDQHGRQLPKDYQHFIQELSKGLDWNTKPKFMGLYPSDEWVKHKELNHPVFSSFSTYSKEDFGVSFGQAEMEGWPALVSGWGGHLDSICSNVLKVPMTRLAESTDELPIIEGKARALARDFVLNKSMFLLETKIENFQLPAPLSLTQLDQIRRKAITKWGIDTLYISRQMSEHFADTKNGMMFYNEFKNVFGHHPTTTKNVLLLHDYNLHLYEKKPESFIKINELAYKSSGEKCHLDVIMSRDIGNKSTLKKLIQAENIYLLSKNESSKLLIKNIETIVGTEKILYLNG